VSPGAGALAGFADGLRAELLRLASAAVLVRPDRTVFGAGGAAALAAAWQASLATPEAQAE
jgi:3-(3-hydroxy-phenyl)propionate hydroxylase